MLSGSTPVHPGRKQPGRTRIGAHREPGIDAPETPGRPLPSAGHGECVCRTELVIIRFGGWLESGRTERRRCEGQDEHDERRDREPSICLCQRVRSSSGGGCLSPSKTASTAQNGQPSQKKPIARSSPTTTRLSRGQRRPKTA